MDEFQPFQSSSWVCFAFDVAQKFDGDLKAEIGDCAPRAEPIGEVRSPVVQETILVARV